MSWGELALDETKPHWCRFVASNMDNMNKFQASLLEFNIPYDFKREITDGRETILIPLANVDQLVDMGWNATGCNVSPELKQLVKARRNERVGFFEDLEDIAELDVHRNLVVNGPLLMSPTDFQIRNLRKMLRYRSAASFSVPGAGKTGEAISYWHAKRDTTERLIVVLPKVAIISWKDELNKWLGYTSREICVLDYTSTRFEEQIFEASDKRVFLITYHKLSTKERILARFVRHHLVDGWSMILDESHNVKNYTGMRSESVRRIGSLVNRCRLILTGTPAPQGMTDLHSQAEFLYGIRIPEERAVDLMERIHVRTTKQDLGLIEPRVHFHTEPHKPEHKAAYENFIEARWMEISDNLNHENRRLAIRPHLSQMILAATDPNLISGGGFESSELPWKYERVLNIVKNVVDDGGKVIVWASYIPVMYGLYNLLSDYLPLMVHGAVKSASNLQEEENPETREWRFNEFKNSTHRNVLIANPGACGESISLHHWCNTAIYVTRNYNAAHFLQSKDRIHRYGSHPETGLQTCQENHVDYHILISSDTTDERVDDRLNQKIDRQSQLLEGGHFSEALNEEGTDHEEGVSTSDIDDIINQLVNQFR